MNPGCLHVYIFVCMPKRQMVTYRYVLVYWHVRLVHSMLSVSGRTASRRRRLREQVDICKSSRGIDAEAYLFKIKKGTGTDIATAALEMLSGWATHKTFANWQGKELS